MAKSITKIVAGKQTTAAVFSEPSEQWTPGWDRKAGFEQAMDRAKARARMGNKKTPKGRGTLIKG